MRTETNYWVPELNVLAAGIADWRRRKGFATDITNVPEKLCLIHSEVSEALEADRSSDAAGFAEELADIIIRVLDVSHSLGIDIAHHIQAKMLKNEGRLHKHGKAY